MAHPAISDEYFVGRMQSGPRKAFRVTLLVSKNKRYCSVLEECLDYGNDTWKPRKGRWYPYEELEGILNLLHRAREEGGKRNWSQRAPFIGDAPSQTSTGKTRSLNWSQCAPSVGDAPAQTSAGGKRSLDDWLEEISNELKEVRQTLGTVDEQVSEQTIKLAQIERLLTTVPLDGTEA